jgi:hypothetical protein
MRIEGIGAAFLLIIGVAIPYLAWKTKQRVRGFQFIVISSGGLLPAIVTHFVDFAHKATLSFRA